MSGALPMMLRAFGFDFERVCGVVVCIFLALSKLVEYNNGGADGGASHGSIHGR